MSCSHSPLPRSGVGVQLQVGHSKRKTSSKVAFFAIMTCLTFVPAVAVGRRSWLFGATQHNAITSCSLKYHNLCKTQTRVGINFSNNKVQHSRSATMRVATDGDSVKVHYTGFLDDGSQFDSSRGGEPLNFVIGAGTVIRGFDDAVRGLRVGESRRSRIEAEQAYGQRSDELVVSISAASVPEELNLKVGDRVPLSNGMSASVLEVNEKEVRLDANHELAGKALTFDMELVGFFEKVLQPVQNGLKRAIFGLGCFWGAELAYQRVKGVVSTKVGYTQGTLVNPSYEQVCSGTSGHVEAVAIDYDESVVSYEELLELFWERLGRSALTLNQVGNDVGSQYRSGIYCLDDSQLEAAHASCEKASKQFGQAVVVEVKDAMDVAFYLAENHHQRYLEKGGQSAEKGASETIRCYG